MWAGDQKLRYDLVWPKYLYKTQEQFPESVIEAHFNNGFKNLLDQQ